MKLFILLPLLFCFVSLAETAPTNLTKECADFKKRSFKSDVEKLNAFMSFYWQQTMTDNPEWASMVGFPGLDDRWSDLSKSALKTREASAKCQLEVFKTIKASGLKSEDRLNYELMSKKLAENAERFQYGMQYLAITQMDGLTTGVPDVLNDSPKTTVKDYENRIHRLEKLPLLIEQTKDLLREGVQLKITHPRFLSEKIPPQIETLLPLDPKQSPLYHAFTEMPSGISAEEKERLQTQSLKLIQDLVYPAFRGLKDFLVKDYIPQCRTSIALSELPNGNAWYSYLVRLHTTTTWSPEKIHELGLQEVQRITAEMDKIREQVKFKGDREAFHKFIGSDPQFFHKDAKDLLAGYREIAKKIDPELPRLFKTLPRLTYGVREMPLYKAPDAPTAYYMPGSAVSGRAGYFEANTFNLSQRPKWEMEVLTSHEAVPGHHLQIALAQEMAALPDFRREEGYTAFVEGWGLYSESLGDDLGLYKDPYSKYGQLVFDMWRAVRLVVDTGMHSMGWSRDRALSYFIDHVPKTRLQAENEIDRYITMPGQALAYKIGQQKFFELRDRAKKDLGESFDIREYHDEVLRHGAVPMDVLEKLFDEWLSQAKKPKQKKVTANY